ncbi:MAG: hypothetical protein CM15mP77_3190 [Synechococcus sp.]|nr:MAG: hypothetical protein CM15mP77_3190 [Synechococcus sp.]
MRPAVSGFAPEPVRHPKPWPVLPRIDPGHRFPVDPWFDHAAQSTAGGSGQIQQESMTPLANCRLSSDSALCRPGSRCSESGLIRPFMLLLKHMAQQSHQLRPQRRPHAGEQQRHPQSQQFQQLTLVVLVGALGGAESSDLAAEWGDRITCCRASTTRMVITSNSSRARSATTPRLITALSGSSWMSPEAEQRSVTGTIRSTRQKESAEAGQSIDAAGHPASEWRGSGVSGAELEAGCRGETAAGMGYRSAS